jgi:hypothetical protein
VLGVGDNLPAALRDLFDTSASLASARTIRATYERLGGTISALQELAERREQVRHLEALVESYEASTSWRLTAPLRRLARLLSSANSVAGELSNRLPDVGTPAPTRPRAPIAS